MKPNESKKLKRNERNETRKNIFKQNEGKTASIFFALKRNTKNAEAKRSEKKNMEEKRKYLCDFFVLKRNEKFEGN
jgi:hypothetical protein